MSKELYKRVTAKNPVYEDYSSQWQYLLESYMGGKMYRDGQYLTRYQLEDDNEYNARLLSTHLDNHCQSVVSVYNSFLFRENPKRDFGQLENLPETEAFLKDADLEGRTLNNFMKEVSTWSSVYGHCWVMVVKPATNANTRADELQQEVRPYIGLMSPLTVLDWEYVRQPNGVFNLTYFKYIETTAGNIQTIKEWTPEVIITYVLDTDKEVVTETIEEVNGINKIPAVLAYNKRSITRGVGLSDINDIADAQRYIYNCNSEIEQSVRLESHPSLVKTSDTEAGIGAGSLIHMPEHLDPGLKPYVLDFDGASVQSILNTIDNVTESIDKMANTGSVRATEGKVLSGVAMQTEFQLLNARLSEKADNLELAEEQIWRLFAMYLDKAWDGEVEYPGSFNIQDTHNEFAQLVSANSATENPQVKQVINSKLVELLGEDPEEVLANNQID